MVTSADRRAVAKRDRAFTLHLSLGTFRWAVGIFGAVIGAMMLVVPHQFNTPVYTAIAPHLPLWGTIFLAVGVGMVAIASFKLPWPFVVFTHLLGGIGFLVLAYGIAVVGGWTGTTNFGALGLGTAIAPFAARPRHWRGTTEPRDPFAAVVGLGASLTGLAIIVAPAQFSNPNYDVIRSSLPFLGIAFFAGGLALVYANTRANVRPDALRAAHLLAGATLLAFLVVSSIPLRAWIGMAYYGGFGALILLLPWLRPRLSQIDPASLQSRMAVTFAAVVGLPLIVVVALVDAVIERSIATGGAVAINEAREWSFAILVVFVVIAAVAGVYASRWLAAPLHALSRAAGELASGFARAKIPQTSVAEIRQLAASFADMQNRLEVRTAERERLLEALRKSEETFRVMFECAPVGIVRVGLDASVHQVNQSICKFLGYRPEELCKLTFHDLTFADDLPADLKQKGRLLTGEIDVYTMEKRFIHKDGSLVWGNLTATVTRETSGQPNFLIGIVEDISDRKRTETEREHLLAEVQRRAADLAAVNKELESFAYSVSHDLRAPQRRIDGFSRALLEDYGDSLDERGKGYLTLVREETGRMGQLIESMLRLSRVTRSEMRAYEVNLSRLAQEIKGELQVTDPGRDVEFLIPPEVMATGDARLLRLVLENLLGNSWKFTSRHPRARIEFGALEQEGEKAYYVRDDGAGFDPAYAEKLFGVFQRLHGDDEFDGIGIGLATVQRIIHRHGGRVWAEGAIEHGATFYFTL